MGEAMATAEQVVTTNMTLDEDTAATARFSRPAMTTKIRGMLPQLIEPWSHTMGSNRKTNSFVLRRGVEDRPEEALVEVRTDEEAEEEEARREEKRQVFALVHSEPIKGIPETLRVNEKSELKA